jgi:hypothetical protein
VKFQDCEFSINFQAHSEHRSAVRKQNQCMEDDEVKGILEMEDEEEQKKMVLLAPKWALRNLERF